MLAGAQREGLWGYLRRSALDGYFFGDVERFEEAIVSVFDQLNRPALRSTGVYRRGRPGYFLILIVTDCSGVVARL